MELTTATKYKSREKEVLQMLTEFENSGSILVEGQRNQIKIFGFEDKKVNVKSFQVPNSINKVAYRFFRKSKAKRSFLYAQHLLSKNIGTPEPIAFAEEITAFSFQRSFYVSEHQTYDLTYRELVQQPNFPNHENILRAFTRFTYDLHEKQIEFLDHSPGNTLIKEDNGEYGFFLVDLNRMNFGKMDFDSRMKNFARLTPKKEMVKIMANEYSQLIKKPEDEVFEKMWFYTNSFQEKFWRKKKLKKKLKFWKK